MATTAKDSVVALGSQVGPLAAVFQVSVPSQRAREEAGFAKDLEAIADTDYGATGAGKIHNGIHHRGEFRDGPGPQVVAVGESAGHDDGVVSGQVAVLMPDITGVLTKHAINRVMAIGIAPRPREYQDAEAHGTR